MVHRQNSVYVLAFLPINGCYVRLLATCGLGFYLQQVDRVARVGGGDDTVHLEFVVIVLGLACNKTPSVD